MTVNLGSTFATYNYYVKNSATALTMQANDPQTKRDITYYEANIGKLKTADDFVNNYTIFNTAMTAFGLSDMAHAKAYMKKVLESDLSDKNSFANRLADDRFVNFAKAFSQFSSVEGASTLNPPMAAADVGKLFLAQSMETTIGTEDQGVQLALYFRRNASSIKSAYTVIGDAAMWKVMTTVYGFPATMGGIDIDQQKKIVEQKFTPADMQDPAKVDKLLQRFTAIWDATENVASDPILALFQTGSSSSTSDAFTSSLLDLKYGG
ncbi:flagellar basal body rod protein FlgF [Azorhizobium oxalatiphilum]|uniref:Flagellar basal body rod protein FlgF n=1 Tax=Azorhizobium oxalatiphilum TaxID=980631 RepID=A0A917C6G0_9HYPH|nr:DUF1217 domain-containing protein [Azorhizobium oxalatiphilum]GGF74302.1 flagellar basal body rod protein FlgF [Azorhizobium oxalatiphilum]